jgi:hypothetical protein
MSLYSVVIENDCLGLSTNAHQRIYADVLDAAEDALSAELALIRNRAAPKIAQEAPRPQAVPQPLVASVLTPSASSYLSESSSSDRSMLSSGSTPATAERPGAGVVATPPVATPSITSESNSSEASSAIPGSGSSGAYDGASMMSGAFSPPETAGAAASPEMQDADVSPDAADSSHGGVAAPGLDTSEDALAIAAAFDDPELSAEDRAAIAAVLLED